MKFSTLSKSILGLFIACCFSQTFAIENSRLKSIKENIQKFNSENHSEILSELLNEANEVDIMNDRCRSISLTDKVDDVCKDFYRITLPNFEKKYSKVTGEIRIGALQMNENLKGKVAHLKACLDALEPFFFINPMSFFNRKIKEEILPLDFDTGEVECKITTSFERDDKFYKEVEKQAQIWNKSCAEDFFVPATIDALSSVKGYYEQFTPKQQKMYQSGQSFAWRPIHAYVSLLYVNGEPTLGIVGKPLAKFRNHDDVSIQLYQIGGLAIVMCGGNYVDAVYEAPIDNSTKDIKAFWSDVDYVNLQYAE